MLYVHVYIKHVKITSLCFCLYWRKLVVFGIFFGSPGVLTIYLGKPEMWLENQMVYAIAFGKLQKIWAVFCDDVIFLLFLVYSTDLDIKVG